MRPFVILGLVLTLAAGLAHAVSTRSFRLSTYKDFDEGELSGVLLSGPGELSGGLQATRVELPAASAFTMLLGADGTTYVGSGDEGVIYAYQKGKVKKHAALDGVLVSALENAPGGRLFAAVVPGGRVHLVERDGKTREIAKLDAEHVWALVYDEAQKTLYAGTGPDGKLFAVELKDLGAGKPRLLSETGDKHLVSLVRGDDGALYAGSAEQAILYRISQKGRLTAVHDFEGDEVRAIAQRNGTLWVAVNQFTKTGSTSESLPSTPAPIPLKGTKIAPPAQTSIKLTPPPSRDRKGKGAIYRVDPDGRVEQLHALPEGYFASLAVDGEGTVWAGTGSKGRVYQIRGDRSVWTALDVPERQVLSLQLEGGERLVGTGDAGALYRVVADPPKDAHYLSKTLDAGFLSRWGSLRWTGSGQVTLATRSGNTAKPDKTWSDWQPTQRIDRMADGGVGKILSPEARYLQIKVGFPAPKSVVRTVTAYYTPQNQRARLTEVTVADEASAKRPSKGRSTVVKLRWKVENPDEDELAYRVFYREEGGATWKRIGPPDPITATHIDWNTESIPDGFYQVKVVVSDERANPAELKLEHELTSAPFLVDNRPPAIEALKVDFPFVAGRARDGFSPLTELAYSVDGGDWLPVAPRDGVFDDPVEDFSFKIADKLSPGSHSLAVRALDAADNVGAVQSAFRVK